MALPPSRKHDKCDRSPTTFEDGYQPPSQEAWNVKFLTLPVPYPETLDDLNCLSHNDLHPGTPLRRPRLPLPLHLPRPLLPLILPPSTRRLCTSLQSHLLVLFARKGALWPTTSSPPYGPNRMAYLAPLGDGVERVFPWKGRSE